MKDISFIPDADRIYEKYNVSGCNKFTKQESFEGVQSHGEPYNPMIIYGSVGCGKTHLLQVVIKKLLING